MITRRDFIKKTSLLLGGTVLGGLSFTADGLAGSSSLFVPDESHPHERTWMAFVANDTIWALRQIPEVKKNLALIAATIAGFEPVSVLVGPGDYEEAKALMNPGKHAYPIELVEFAVDDLWLRDTGPTFVTNSLNEKIAVDFNFNGWGNKQAHARDAKVASFIAARSKAIVEKTDLVLEGGCFEVDGHGTGILTQSCVVNKNRNPHLTQAEIEKELKALLGLRKIIWLEGIKGRDITDGHTDFYARFTRPGHVLVGRDNDKASYDYGVTRENIDILTHSRDADGNALDVTIIDTPDVINERFGIRDFAAGYIGYYVCNGGVIAQKFGDAAADENARAVLQKAFPGRSVVQIAIDGIASGGGSIHCATQQEPAV